MKTVAINWTQLSVGCILLLQLVFFSQGDSASESQGDDGRLSQQASPSSPSSSTSSQTQQRSDDDLSSLPANCTARQAKRYYRYASIRDDILRKLRLETPPNVTLHRLPAIPQLQSIIDEMCRQRGASCEGARTDDGGGRAATTRPTADSTQADDYDDDVRATTIKILLFPTAPDAASQASVSDGQQTCRFRFQSDIVHNDIVSATFGVYIRRVTNAARRSPHMATWVLVYALRAVASGRPPERQLVHRRRIYLDDRNTGRWHHFRCLALVRRWIANPHSNQGLFVQATDSRGEPLAVIQPNSDAEQPYKPYLELMVSSSQQSTRSKRTTELDCDDQSSERRCCRYPLVVDFDRFGWDWVIVPRRYSAYYCSGECPFLYMQTHGPGTHVRQQQQQQQQQQQTAVRPAAGAGGGPCCSPRRVSSISMLYYDKHMNIVYGRLPEMVVEQCGCA